ncbi:hypothetical protein DFH06DRAFT_1336956 [Mycena polygramma]|nr:hypothetical protein DFH06DRAFT_1336956 [Mycena polygramma]
MVIDSLTLQDYHEVYHWTLDYNSSISIPPGVAVDLGAVVFLSPNNDLVEIASPLDGIVDFYHWIELDGEEITDVENGWTSWPKLTVYWFLDPSGVQRFSTEEASKLGFPPLEMGTSLDIDSSDSGLYAGLRKFHQPKGFDPYSQDLARDPGSPLYQPAPNIDASFAHLDNADDNFEADVRDSPMQVDEIEAEEQDDGNVPSMDLNW